MPVVRSAATVAQYLTVPFVGLAIWQIVALAIDDPNVLTTVPATAGTFVDGLDQDWLLSGFGLTMREMALGFAFAAPIGLVIGALLGLNRTVGQVADPFLVAFWAAPKVLLYPICLLLFGLGTASKAALAFSFAVFPVISLTLTGVKGARAVHLRAARVHRYSAWKIFYKIVIPSALPEVITGLRYAFSLSFLGAILGEMFASKAGIGYNLLVAQGAADIARMLSILTLIGGVGIAGTTILLGVEKLVYRRMGRDRSVAAAGL